MHINLFRKYLLIYFLMNLFCCFTYGQDKQSIISQLEEEYTKTVEKKYQTILASSTKMTPDSAKQKIFKLLKIIDKYKDVDAFIDNRIDYTKGHMLLHIASLHQKNKIYDSVRYYLDYVSDNIKDKDILGRQRREKAKLELYNFNYEKYILNISEALEFAEECDNVLKKQLALLSLSRFYRISNQFDLAKSIQKELQQSITNSTSLTIKFSISVEDYYLKSQQQKFNEAFLILKSFKDTKITRKNIYNFTIADAYLNLKKYDSALYYLKKNELNIKDPFSYYNKVSTIYHHKKDFLTALEYHNKISEKQLKDNSFQMSKYYINAYEIHKSLGNESLALKYLENYNEEKIKLDEKINKKQVAHFKYELKKSEDVKQLELEKRKQESLIQKNKRKYIFQLIVISIISVSAFIIFLLLYKRKKEREQLKLKQHNEINTLKNQYIENITHEFKTPVSVSLGYLDLIKTNTVKANKRNNYIDLAQDINKKLIKNLDDLLTFIKLDNTSSILKDVLTEQNLFDFLQFEIQKFEHSYLTKDLTVKLTTNINPEYRLKFDYAKLEKVLNNLLGNAIKFSKIGQTIYIVFLLDEQGITFQVKDEGLGIDITEQHKIFDRFYQSDKHKYSGGFGIGLFLVNNIIKSWNGKIDLTSQIDKGATFSLKIPLTSIDLGNAISNTTEFSYFEKEIDDVIDATIAKILIVENQLEMINYLSHIFAINYYCDFAFNGEEAYERIKENTYELIVSDYKMPVMDGLELKSKLNENPETAKIPYILISASNIEDKLDLFREDNLFTFLKKPFTEIELKSLINSFIGNGVNTKAVTQIQENSNFLKEDNMTVFLKKVNQFILRNLDNDMLKIADIASHIGYSQRQFSKIINDYTNLNPNKIVLEIRLLKAYEFLKNGQYRTIGEVMAAIGINSRSYFYKAFEERFGLKVGEMIKTHKRSS
ncbi:sensor histidine kinase TodS [Kordia sp. SMS9]|uniref:ATP-binding protein n=1 Tax=Kordia sp. SMS9 TaxID=2282170 RepID=UPI000E0D96A5|nr:ATP-binding protein [Kordia sp. SMS9]AXG70680.1 sensor histidine kinase TodS [Kordia sp. SMS9]